MSFFPGKKDRKKELFEVPRKQNLTGPFPSDHIDVQFALS